MKKSVPSNQTIPVRQEKHEGKNWYALGFNHKTTTTMGLLIPLAMEEVYPGEKVKLSMQYLMRFAGLYLPLMHNCYVAVDWFYTTYDILWKGNVFPDTGWQNFIKQDPTNPSTTYPFIEYLRSDAVWTNGLYNYLGFQAPPPSGTLSFSVQTNAMPAANYLKLYDEYYRNELLQPERFEGLNAGVNNYIYGPNHLPDMRCLRRNWPRDYFTAATPEPQQGENVLIPSFETDLESGLHVPQNVFTLEGLQPVINSHLIANGSGELANTSEKVVLQLSSTMRDFRYANSMTEFLERQMRAGGDNMRYSDFVKRNFGYDPNPLIIDRPVWLGGHTGHVVISEVLSTSETTNYAVGEYAGQALSIDKTRQLTYTCPDYGYITCLMSVYPRASYYTGMTKKFQREFKLDYMFEQFALIGDQPLLNKEVWFSWYEADRISGWLDEIYGYVPQYAWEKYNQDIVSGQMRTLWQSFHLGRNFQDKDDVILNSDFVTCTPDIGRVFLVDAEAGEHECYINAKINIDILRRLPKNAIPAL